MLIDYLLCPFQEIILIADILFQIIMYQRLKSKTFNVLIDQKSFFDLSVKNEEETYEKIIEMSNYNDYTTSNLLDFAYYKKMYNLIATDLSKQTKLKDPQQINFIGKLKKKLEQQCSLSQKNQKKLLLIFHKILSQ